MYSFVDKERKSQSIHPRGSRLRREKAARRGASLGPICASWSELIEQTVLGKVTKQESRYTRIFMGQSGKNQSGDGMNCSGEVRGWNQCQIRFSSETTSMSCWCRAAQEKAGARGDWTWLERTRCQISSWGGEEGCWCWWSKSPFCASLVPSWVMAQFSANGRNAGDGLQVAANCPRSERASGNAFTFLKYCPHYTQQSVVFFVCLPSFCLPIGCVDGTGC